MARRLPISAVLLAVTVAIAACAPSAAKTIPLVEFVDHLGGFRTYVPQGWIEVQRDTFVPSLPSEGLPTTVLTLQFFPLLTIDQAQGLVATSLGLETVPSPHSSIIAGSGEWSVHQIVNTNPSIAGELIEIAFTQSDDGVLAFVLQAPREDHPGLYEDVLVEAIRRMSLIPLETTSAHHAYTPPASLEDGWQTAALSQVGLDVDVIRVLEDRLVDGTYGGVQSVLIARNGLLVFEQYLSETTVNSLQEIYSITKSISSALVGIAVDEGFITGVDVPIVDLLPDYAHLFTDDRKRRITVEHILTHTSGLEWDEHTYSYEDSRNSEYGMYYGSEDWIAYVLSRPMRDEPGERYEYNTGAVHLLSAILEAVVGSPLDDFARQYLFDPLGIEMYEWLVDPMGYPRTGATHGGLRMTARDVAKIGQLYLDDGQWAGAQLVASSWVEQSLVPRIGTPSDTGGMGYLWFLNAFQFGGHALETFVARGFGGQTLLVTPELDLVVVITCAPDSNADTLGLNLLIYKATMAR